MKGTTAAMALRELAAMTAEPSRLSRGRQYYRQHRVEDVVVESRRVTAWVEGSHRDPYEVTLSCRSAPDDVGGILVELVAAGLTLSAAIDEAVGRDLAVAPESMTSSCTCRDWGEPCKHAVAAMLAFADGVALEPRILLQWRDIDCGPEAEIAPPAANDPAVNVARALLDRLTAHRSTPTGHGLAAVPDDPIDSFFVGGVPADGDVLGDHVPFTPLPSPFEPGKVVLDNIDIHNVSDLCEAFAKLNALERKASGPSGEALAG